MPATLMNERDYDKKTLGPIVLEYLAKKMESSLTQREGIDSKRILDLQFNDFVSNPLSFAYNIYDYFNLNMDNKTKNRMEEYAEQHPLGKHGKHDYNFAEFGLSENMILDRFGFYIERFNIPMA